MSEGSINWTVRYARQDLWANGSESTWSAESGTIDGPMSRAYDAIKGWAMANGLEAETGGVHMLQDGRDGLGGYLRDADGNDCGMWDAEYVRPEVLVYMDSYEDIDAPELALRAEYVNGSAALMAIRPVVTAEEFRRFISAWERNDHNGTWNSDGVTECSSVLLVYVDGEENVSTFNRVDSSDHDGASLYEISDFVAWRS